MNTNPPHSGSGAESSSDPTLAADGQGPTQDLAVGPALSVGSMFGGYRIEGLLGYGGAGIVYRARQNRPDREVALKVIRPGAATIQGLKRLELEAEVLGRLQHPGIAQVYEAGTADTPIGKQPFFAMELVTGDSLTAFATKNQLGTRQRLELFAKVCEAVQHAHSKGVIHRDLKPSNILVTAEGQPKVLDFGVARVTDHDVQLTTIHTNIGQLIGTVPYMSPEQVSGDSASLDTLSDVYALGVILYELLTGRMPYDLSKKLIHEAARIICEDEPTRLSSIDRMLRGDVETIVAKAMEKEKERRYQTASDIGSDISRFLRDEPISARPASASYQFRKFASRNKALAVFLIGTFVVLSLGLVVTSVNAMFLYEAKQKQTAARESEYRHRMNALAIAARSKIDAERAERESVAADEARALAQAREFETEQVAEYQRSIFESVGIYEFGEAIADGLIEQMRAHQVRAASGNAVVHNVTVVLEHARRQGVFTDVASGVVTRVFAKPAAERLDLFYHKTSLQKSRLLEVLARLLILGNDVPTGVRVLDRAVAIRQLHGDAESDESLRLTTFLSECLQMEGRSEEAEMHLRHVAEACERRHGPTDERTLAAKARLGSLLMRNGRHAEAQMMLTSVLSHAGESHTSRLTVLRALGVLALVRQDHESYVEYVELMMPLSKARQESALDPSQALRLLLQETDPFGLDIVEPAMIVATLTQSGLETLELSATVERGIEGVREWLGNLHPLTLNLVRVLGDVRSIAGELSAAESCFLEAHDGLLKSLGALNVCTVQARLGLGSVRRRMGCFALAEEDLIAVQQAVAAGAPVPAGIRFELHAQAVLLYLEWHGADPAAGHDSKAAVWQARLDRLAVEERTAP